MRSDPPVAIGIATTAAEPTMPFVANQQPDDLRKQQCGV